MTEPETYQRIGAGAKLGGLICILLAGCAHPPTSPLARISYTLSGTWQLRPFLPPQPPPALLP